MPPPRLGSGRELVAELPPLAATLVALLATLALEHFVVHLQIVLPTLALTATPPFWMYAAMVVPELVVFFVAGYRLRTSAPGHLGPSPLDRYTEFATRTPVVAIGYLLVLAVAAWSGEDERRLAGDA